MDNVTKLLELLDSSCCEHFFNDNEDKEQLAEYLARNGVVVRPPILTKQDILELEHDLITQTYVWESPDDHHRALIAVNIDGMHEMAQAVICRLEARQNE